MGMYIQCTTQAINHYLARRITMAPTNAELKEELEALKAAPAPSIFTCFSDIRDIVCITTGSLKRQAIKADRIIDISTDAILHTAEYLDHTTRANLATVQQDSPL